MKALFLSAVALLAVISSIMVFSGVRHYQKYSLGEVERFNQWRAKFGKLYASPSESGYRMDVVIKKMRTVDSWNTEYAQYLQANNLPPMTEPMFVSMGWDDLTEAEFKKAKTGLKIELRSSDEVEEANLESSDFVQEVAPATSLGQTGYIHKIRDQGECGSCWAFSTIATLERQYHTIKKTQIDLSVQELVDCSTADYGCDGGWPTNTYEYIRDNGIQNAASYPYYGNQYYCEADQSKRIWFDSTYVVREVAFNTANAKKCADNQIVAGTVVHSAGKLNNLGTSPDIYDAAASGECSKAVDHAVNVQSSGTDANGRFYVLLQNSWGTTWGAKGVKKIYPCGASKFWGSTAILSHTSKNGP